MTVRSRPHPSDASVCPVGIARSTGGESAAVSGPGTWVDLWADMKLSRESRAARVVDAVP
ncbi:hypothetical protein SAMN05216276_101584 [Streptosporangium subroseum]|uniref:Uncharacterized protein n=1 Tax=Streptosporangium subroseum TaxID=106412 RepID=A0A239H4J4_9ACTN|nr:hypothetical protein SAMN05216276_101584 [Streptosporangium subroseum]